MKKWLTPTALAAAAALLFAGCSKAPASTASGSSSNLPPVTIRYGVVGTRVGGYTAIAQAKGYFDTELKKVNAKIEITPFPGAGPAINAALASQKLDGANLGDVPALIEKASGIDTTAVSGSLATTVTGIYVRTDSNYTSVKDLKGKKVATQKGAYMQRTLDYLLKANGMSFDDIQFVNMTGIDAQAAIMAKSVDAICVSIPAKLIDEKIVKDIADNAGHDEWLNSGETVFLTDFAKKNPEVVKAFLRALIETKQYADKNPDVLYQDQKDSGLTDAQIAITYPDKNYTTDLDISSALVKSVTDTNAWLLANKLTTNSVDVKKWFDASYYNAALKEVNGK